MDAQIPGVDPFNMRRPVIGWTILVVIIVIIAVAYYFLSREDDEIDISAYDNWEKEPRDMLKKLVDDLGAPEEQEEDYVAWTQPQLKEKSEGKCWDRLTLKNELIAVKEPVQHNEFLYGEIMVDLDKNQHVNELGTIYIDEDNPDDTPIQYLPSAKVLRVRCSSVNGLAAKAYLAVLMLSGHKETDWTSKYREVMMRASKEESAYNEYMNSVCRFKSETAKAVANNNE